MTVLYSATYYYTPTIAVDPIAVFLFSRVVHPISPYAAVTSLVLLVIYHHEPSFILQKSQSKAKRRTLTVAVVELSSAVAFTAFPDISSRTNLASYYDPN